MKHAILLITFFAVAGLAGTTGYAAQDAPRVRTAAPAEVHGVGCETDSFGALRCADGALLPGGAFGVTPRQPKPASIIAAKPGRSGAPDPLAMMRGDGAEEGNLYGDPAATPRGSDGYGCRVGPNGELLCH